MDKILPNSPLITALSSFCIAQFLKLLIIFIKDKRISYENAASTGGMPSSHSAGVTALTTMIALNDGIDSSVFAVSLVFSCVVMYDAAGIRRAAGRHAEAINELSAAVHGENASEKILRTLLGHTQLQVVAGALVGIAVAVIFNRFIF